MQHSSSFHQKKNNATPNRPEVADRETPPETSCPDGDLRLAINPRTEELEDLKTFKVFLKKNLALQTPPPGLLSAIYDRVDQIKATES